MTRAIAKYAAFSASFLIACGGETLPSTGSSAADNGTPIDGGSDSGTGASPCVDACVSTELSWDLNGGLADSSEVSTLSCKSYTHQEDNESGDLSCTDTLSGACGSPGITVGQVANAFFADDVQTAFKGSTPLYGSDPRGCDGAVLDITYQSKTIEVGGDCSDSKSCVGAPPPVCVPIPAGVKALADLLRQLDQQELETKNCASVFPGR
jgi:hypothetical protein